MTAIGGPVPVAGRWGPVLLAPRRVAWPTVVGLAAAMAYVDMFWVVSLREVAGAIERTSDPFADWLRESALLLPTYVLSVLWASSVSRRLHLNGPVVGRRVVATALLLVALSTVVGVLVLAASSVYDYRLEMALLEHTRHAGCLGDCLDSQRTSTVVLQLKSLGYGSAIILVTNLMLVGWVTALLGGRLRLDHPADPRRIGSLRGVHRPNGLSAMVAATLVGAAVIHAAVAPAHAVEWPAAAAFFAVLAGIETLAAMVVVHRPSRSAWWAAAMVSAAPLAIWLWSRTVGLPLGPEAGTVEPVGLADTATVILELTTLVLLGMWARFHRRPSDSGMQLAADRARIVLAAIVAVIAIGLGGSGIGWLDVTGSAAHAQSFSP